MQSPFISFFRRSPAGAVLLAALLCLLFPLRGRAAERQVLHGHVPAVVSQLAPVGLLDATQHLDLAIALPLRNQQALTDLLRRLYDPASPSYRRFLTPAQFAAQFGPAEEDYETVAAFAKANGLTVTHRYSNRLLLDVNGAVSDIEKALHVTMRVYAHPTEARTFYAPDTEPSLDLAVPIAHISGLDNYTRSKPCLEPVPAARAAGAKPSSGSGPSGTYMGNDFRAAYAPGVSLTGSGETIGLLEFDGYTDSDITYYENQAGLPNVTLTNVLLDSFNGHPTGNGGEVEVSLDIEVAISMAPGVSDIIVYEAGPNGNWHDMLNRMADDNLAKQLSCSWYEPGQGDDPVADGIFQEMETQGQSFFCASGDSDAYTGAIPFPEDNVLVTEVGGTTLTTTGPGGAWSSETVWNWGYDSNAGEYVGSSGGISTQYSIPAWQQGVSMAANKGSTTMRNVPDVALTADNVQVRADGSNQDEGGTSCAAPLWAAFTALVNQQAAANGMGTIGFINPAVYAIGQGSGYTSAFHDTTTGNNTSSSSPTQFYAAAGYDLCTGWGTPNGAALINALVKPADNLQITATSAFSSSGGVGGPFAPGTNNYTLSNAGSASLTWSASATQNWLSLSATAGTLAPNGSSTVTASINANANALASGTYSDTITFTDVTTGYTQTRPVSLSVVTAPVITSGSTATAANGAAFSYQIAASNSPASYNASGLPSGLSVNTTSGLISGSTTATGTSNVTISAINAGGTGSAILALTVLPPAPVIIGTLTATATNGAAFSYQINATNNPASYGASGLPSGLSVNTTSGLISGSTTATGTSKVTISATNTGGSGKATLVITVLPPPPAITSASTATAVNGDAFSYRIAASNNPSSYGASGLPSGLGVNTATGLISGVATVSGTSDVTISATNTGGSGGANLMLTVVTPPAPVIISALTASAVNGNTFTYQIAATNSPFSYSASGLPSGLRVNASTGLISGVATVSGTSSVTIGATNAGGSGGATLVLTVITPPPPAITSALTATAANGNTFTYQIAASNDPTGYGATGLPAGLGVNTTTGLISGATTATGTSNVTISATNAGGPGSATLVLTVLPPPPVITSALTATAPNGTAFSYQIAAANNPASYGASGLPAGLSVNTTTGLISGTTTATGMSNVTVSAANVAGKGSANLVLTVSPPLPVITSALTATAANGNAFTYQIAASNNPTSYGASGLPSGLRVNTATGLISGATAATGTSNVILSATNAGGPGSATLVLTVLPPPPVVTGVLTATAANGTAFSYQIAATNNPTSYRASGLPSGLGVNTTTGLISGTTTATGTSNVTIGATNAGGTGNAALGLTVLPPLPVITSGSSAAGVQGQPFAYQITATNSPTGYDASGLPAGLAVSAGSGLISGTPTSTGTFTLNISATNPGGTQSGSLVIALVVPSGSLTATLVPAGANMAGAQWNVDGGLPQNSGATVSAIPIGLHTVNYISVPGYATPASQGITINYAQTTAVTGTYVGIPVIAVQQPAGQALTSGAGTVNFGVVTSGSTAQQTFTLLNNGAANLTGIACEITGTDASEFQAGAPGMTTLLPGGSTTFTVTYSPADIRASAAALNITSNDPVTPSFEVALAATGTNGPANLEFAAGTFAGLVDQSGTGGGTTFAGFTDLTLGKTGHLTGKLLYGGVTLAVNGSFDSNGNFSGKPGILALLLSSGSGGESNSAGYWMDGSLTGQNGPAPFKAYHAAYAPNEAVPEAGKYTMLLSGTDAVSSIPQGTGYAYATVAGKGGVIRIKGKLADGTAFSASGVLVGGANGDRFLLFDPKLYGKTGLFAGSILFEPTTGSDCDGVMEWLKPASGSALYPQGFDTSLNLDGSTYVKPAANARASLSVDGTLAFSDGGMSAPILEPVAVSPQGTLVVTGSNPEDLKIRVDTSTGGISGSFLSPVSLAPVSFSGVLYQNTNSPGAGGFFIGPTVNGTSLSGNMTLSP